MRKLFSLFLALVATTSLWAHNFEVGGIYYKYLDGNNVEVTYCGDSYESYKNEYAGEVTIPETVTYDGATYNVASIGDSTFVECTSLTSVTIPNSVISIGEDAFAYCSSLTSVTIPNSVTSIGEDAFYGCSSLTSVFVEEGNTTYDSRDNCNAIIETATNTLIAGCQNTIIPNSVTSIGDGAFFWCSSLTSITIPNSVTSIGDYAFAYCSSLTSVTIPNNVTSIGHSAFSSCYYLTSVTCLGTTPPTLGTDVFNRTKLSAVYIPDNTLSAYQTAWGNEYVFVNNETTLTLHVATPGTLADLIFDAGTRPALVVKLILTGTLNDADFTCMRETMTSLVDVDLSGITNTSGVNFRGKENLVRIILPTNLTSIGDNAFNSCRTLTSVTIGNSVTSIGNSAFNSCYSLTSVTIPNSVTSIGTSAFSSCSSLTSVTIGNSVESIGFYAFYYCSSLTSITIPNSVTSIGRGAFSGCSSLVSMVVESGNTKYDSRDNCNAIIETATNILIAGCQNTIIPNSVTSIGESAFASCSSLTSITIPNSVTSIGSGAFYYCSSLTSITIPNRVTSIGDRAFWECSGLTSINVFAEVPPTLGTNAFYNVSTTIPVYVPCGSAYAYQSAEGWNKFTTIQELLVIYSIEVGVNDSIMGTSRVDYNTCSEGAQISATPNFGYHFVQWNDGNSDNPRQVQVTGDTTYTATFDKNTYAISLSCNEEQGSVEGVTSAKYLDTVTISATPNINYHFVQWSDGVTDNPRTLELTQDTILTAEFAPNTYTITTVSSDTQRGTTQGDTTVNYLEYITISASASYGYHFVQWNDGNSDNPRQVQVTGDTTYTATFDKNTYAISLSCNEEQGSVEGVTSAEYLDTVTISATPNFGYHFVQWSDGVTDNPRTLELTQDTILIAEFAQSFSGQCGDSLYWEYDSTNKTITITGSGDMYNYTADTQPWLLFKEEIKEVIIANTATSIGTSAFEECIRLGKVSIGTATKNIAANAFAACTKLYDIYCLAAEPPTGYTSSFANYNAFLHVPCESQRLYMLDILFGEFKYIECIASDEVPTDDIVITPGSTDVTITWPTKEGADTYTIVIKKGNEVFCTLTFNADGQLLNIAFAPGRNGNHPAQYAEAVANGKGFRFTVTGLEEGTDYTYDITVKDASNQTINSHTGAFTTQSTTAVENTHSQSPMTNCQKIFRNGQLIILRDGVEYNAMGQEIQ